MNHSFGRVTCYMHHKKGKGCKGPTNVHDICTLMAQEQATTVLDLLIADTWNHVGTVLKQWQTASLHCKVPATWAFESFQGSGEMKGRGQQIVNAFQFQQQAQAATVWNSFCVPSWHPWVYMFHCSIQVYLFTWFPQNKSSYSIRMTFHVSGVQLRTCLEFGSEGLDVAKIVCTKLCSQFLSRHVILTRSHYIYHHRSSIGILQSMWRVLRRS